MKISEYGDLMEIQDFIECCESGGFIDYDGFGHYSDGVSEFEDTVVPSDITGGNVKDYSHVVWYNR